MQGMNHTKRSPEFKQHVDRVLVRLNSCVFGDLTPEDKEQTLKWARELLTSHTTDSPCVVKAADDEPLFVLRGQDETSDEFVFLWAQKLRTLIANLSVQIDDATRDKMMTKWQDALMCAAEMRTYPSRKRPD